MAALTIEGEQKVKRGAASGATSLDRAMSRYADGEDKAFDEVALGLRPLVIAFLIRMSTPPDLAQDLVQETLFRAHRARFAFSRDGSVVPWAFTIARNCLIAHLRTNRIKTETYDDFALQVGAEASAESAIAARESAVVIARTLEAMPAHHREAFFLLRCDGLHTSLAAEVAGVSRGALKTRAFRAYKAIREALGASETTELATQQ